MQPLGWGQAELNAEGLPDAGSFSVEFTDFQREDFIAYGEFGGDGDVVVLARALKQDLGHIHLDAQFGHVVDADDRRAGRYGGERLDRAAGDQRVKWRGQSRVFQFVFGIAQSDRGQLRFGLCVIDRHLAGRGAPQPRQACDGSVGLFLLQLRRSSRSSNGS